MINVISVCLRWSPRLKKKGDISPQEIANTEKIIIKVVQVEAFNAELKCLEDKLSVPKNSQLLRLDPFIDEEGILRVGGRIHMAALPENEKHPVILPQNYHLTKLFVELCFLNAIILMNKS